MMKLRTNLGLLAWFPGILVAVLEVYMELAGLGVIRSLTIIGGFQELFSKFSLSQTNFLKEPPLL